MKREPSARLPVPQRTAEAWTLALLVGVAGGLVGAFYGGLFGSAQRSAPVSLRPYLDPGWTNPVVRWLSPALESPNVASLLLAAGVAALVLLADGVIRRAFLAPKPAAAALASTGLLLTVAFGAALKLEGHSGIVAGLLPAAVGAILVLEGRGTAVWIGLALSAIAALLHPAWLGVPVAMIACSAGRCPREAVVALVFAAVPVIVALTLPPATEPTLAWPDRLSFALRDLAAAPVLAFSPSRRLDIPTGYEMLVSSAPVIAGLAIHALLLGVGMMIGGIVRVAVAAAAAAVSVLAAALLVPGYVPGDRAFMLPAMAAWVPVVALILAALPRKIERVMPGLIIGAGVIAVVVANDHAPPWTRLGAALDIVGARDFAKEPDPARLVLYLNDVSLRDPDAAAVVAAADRLIAAKAPALHPKRLEALLDKLMLRTAPPPKSSDLAPLLADLTKELTLVERLWRENPRVNFEPAATALIGVHPIALELYFKWKNDPEAVQAVQRFTRIARDINPVATRAGYYEFSLPLIEALSLMGPEDTSTLAAIALQRVVSGDVEHGRPELEAVLKKLPAKGHLTGVVRGVLGRTMLEAGDPRGALTELQAAWGLIGAGGPRIVEITFPSDSVDYFVIAEILLARYEAAKAVDPALMPQAARDLEELLKGPLSFGPRRWPALTIMARLELLRGNRDRAIALLREARRIPAKSLDDRADGPIGRIAHPRYRRMALETLLAALGDGPDVAQEREEVSTELAPLLAGR